jgi:hypothetical protein
MNHTRNCGRWWPSCTRAEPSKTDEQAMAYSLSQIRRFLFEIAPGDLIATRLLIGVLKGDVPSHHFGNQFGSVLVHNASAVHKTFTWTIIILRNHNFCGFRQRNGHRSLSFVEVSAINIL